MHWACFLLSVVVIAISGSTTRAADYGKIDRTIKMEPTYFSKAPKYALLLFGREANVRVWTVFDAETIYIDRNGDGDLLLRQLERRKGFADVD